MVSFYSIVYSVLSVLLLIYGFSSKKAKLNLFSYALALNIFPLAFSQPLAMGDARISGIPIGYIPMIAAGLVLMLSDGIKINNNNKKLIVIMIFFLFYTLFVALVKGISFSTFIYWLMWLFNFLLLVASINIFSKVNFENSYHILRKILIIFFLGTIIGIFRYFVGLDDNSNFMPMFNRNGTIVMVVMLTPLIFFLLDNKFISRLFFWSSYITIFICLLFLQSRSGFLGFVLLSFLYLLFSGKVQIGKIVLIATIVIAFLASPFGEKIMDRLSVGLVSSTTVLNGDTIAADESDYKRNMLLLSAIEIIKNDFWFGAGVGMENYQKAFHKYVNFYHHNSMAHNFYLSYFAELGFFGFSLLIVLLFSIYIKLSKNKKFIAFRISFLGVAFMMTMNEYIGLPELWFFFGMLIGISINEKKEFHYDRVR